MLNSKNTETCIMALMEKGAKLVYHIRSGCEEYPAYVEKITIQHNGKELVLSRFGHWDKEPFMRSVETSMADRLRKHPDIHRAYAGYRGDFDRKWREIYEHKNQPVPRWIREQWATPVSQFDDNS